ncbi:MAG TPA: Xaa-Pro peptidase family protein [Candidatus Sulfomarinibacteraceae bacterium]|nr:Xaa-Pro peptidase family protein [Candidatus Sulfomarinibacteraceae bacterium]
MRVGWPHPADFSAPPTQADRERWLDADRAARPRRLDALRDRMVREGVDGYFGVRWEHMRYLTGLPFDEDEVTGSGDSGKFLVTGSETVVLADSRYTIAVRRDAPESRPFECYNALADRWPDLVAGAGVTRVAVEAMSIPHLTWERLAAAAPDVELIPVEGWVEAVRQVKEPSELERVAAACAVADRALASLLPSIRPGVTERELALDLEWRIRTGGAERLAFSVACLAGAEAALPHGSPGDRPVELGSVLLFDFGAQVAGYRSDMTRTLFVGEPAERDLSVYGLVAAAQEAVFAALADAVGPASQASGAPLPTGPAMDALARSVIEADGRWPVYGHGLGHGIGLATHELPGLGRRSPDAPLPSPTVFSVEPGIYLENEMGVRIEDLVHLDAEAGRVEVLTRFPSGVVIVGA